MSSCYSILQALASQSGHAEPIAEYGEDGGTAAAEGKRPWRRERATAMIIIVILVL
jgi:hypothetical protein